MFVCCWYQRPIYPSNPKKLNRPPEISLNSPSKPLGTDPDHNQTSLFHALISYLLISTIIYVLFSHLSGIYQTVTRSHFSD